MPHEWPVRQAQVHNLLTQMCYFCSHTGSLLHLHSEQSLLERGGRNHLNLSHRYIEDLLAKRGFTERKPLRVRSRILNMASLNVTNASRRRETGPCPFCGRRLALTFHHLIPKKVHRRARYRRRFSREELALGIYLCRDCHDGIHATYSEVELATALSSPEALAGDSVLARHFAWVGRQRRRLI